MNRLGNASSPYLLQHRDNPVHWWEWGPEALRSYLETKAIGVPGGYLQGIQIQPEFSLTQVV